MTRLAVRMMIVVGIVATDLAAQIRYVDDDAPAGGDGTSWETAYRFLQDGLADAAGAGGGVSEIRVAQGVYIPDRDEANPGGTGDDFARFSLSGNLALRGGFLGLGAGKGRDPDERDIELYETVLSGDLNGDDVVPGFLNFEENSIYVVYADNLEDPFAVEGVTVRGGCNTGLFVTNANASCPCEHVVAECTFTANFGQQGSGMWVDRSEVRVTDCGFVDNQCRGIGGAMFISVVLDGGVVRDCVFSGNRAIGDEGFGGSGGAIGVINSTTAFVNCLFADNHASGEGLPGGGAARIDGAPPFSPAFVDCVFVGNTAGFGGACLTNQFSGAAFANCAFIDNQATADGGAMYGVAFSGGTPTLRNCTMVGNTAAGAGGGLHYTSGHPVLFNTILWGNSDSSGNDEGAQLDAVDVTVNYSCLQGWTGGIGGIGNIGDDPLFLDESRGDYRLSAGSPCIDAGHNWAVPQDALDLDGDGVTTELLPFDLDGNPRFSADEADFDPGCGVPVVVDMGAHEYPFDPVDRIRFADVDGDGDVGVFDLIAVIVAWGECDGCCLADLDLDGVVGVSDLVTLIVHWG